MRTSRHFHDAAYYLKRAGEHAKLGALETLDPVVERVRSALGREPEPEPEQTRVEAFVAEVRDVEFGSEGEGRGALGTARARLGIGRRTE